MDPTILGTILGSPIFGNSHKANRKTFVYTVYVLGRSSFSGYHWLDSILGTRTDNKLSKRGATVQDPGRDAFSSFFKEHKAFDRANRQNPEPLQQIQLCVHIYIGVKKYGITSTTFFIIY